MHVFFSIIAHHTLALSYKKFSYGITAFDTSAYYGPSEIVLGAALKSLETEFPRSSYKLVREKKLYEDDDHP